MSAVTTAGNNALACPVPIQATPDGYVRVTVRGKVVDVGDGDKLADCFFSRDNGATALAFTDVRAGDLLYWNSLVSFALELGDLIEFDYIEKE